MRTRGLTLLAVAAVLAIGASDASSAARDSDDARVSIQPLRAASLVLNGNIRIDARFRTISKGTFRITGAISDAGALTATRRVSGRRLQLTQTLAGSEGTIRIRSTHPCSGKRATWRVLSGSKAYAGLTGGGTAPAVAHAVSRRNTPLAPCSAASFARRRHRHSRSLAGSAVERRSGKRRSSMSWNTGGRSPACACVSTRHVSARPCTSGRFPLLYRTCPDRSRRELLARDDRKRYDE